MARSEESIRRQKETMAARKAAREAEVAPVIEAGKQELRAAAIEVKKKLKPLRVKFFAEYKKEYDALMAPVRQKVKKSISVAKKTAKVPLTPEEEMELEATKLLRQERAKIREKERKLKEERARLKEKVRAEVAARHATGGGESDAEEDGSENGAVDEQADEPAHEYQAAE